MQLPAMAEAGLVQATPGVKAVHDFCAGRLRLDHVVQWTPPGLVGDHYETTARYTYAVDAAPWTAGPRLQQAFPMVARVIKGEHSAQLAQRLQFVDGRWEAVVAIE